VQGEWQPGLSKPAKPEKSIAGGIQPVLASGEGPDDVPHSFESIIAALKGVYHKMVDHFTTPSQALANLAPSGPAVDAALASSLAGVPFGFLAFGMSTRELKELQQQGIDLTKEIQKNAAFRGNIRSVLANASDGSPAERENLLVECAIRTALDDYLAKQKKSLKGKRRFWRAGQISGAGMQAKGAMEIGAMSSILHSGVPTAVNATATLGGVLTAAFSPITSSFAAAVGGTFTDRVRKRGQDRQYQENTAVNDLQYVEDIPNDTEGKGRRLNEYYHFIKTKAAQHKKRDKTYAIAGGTFTGANAATAVGTLANLGHIAVAAKSHGASLPLTLAVSAGLTKATTAATAAGAPLSLGSVWVLIYEHIKEGAQAIAAQGGRTNEHVLLALGDLGGEHGGDELRAQRFHELRKQEEALHDYKSRIGAARGKSYNPKHHASDPKTINEEAMPVSASLESNSLRSRLKAKLHRLGSNYLKKGSDDEQERNAAIEEFILKTIEAEIGTVGDRSEHYIDGKIALRDKKYPGYAAEPNRKNVHSQRRAAAKGPVDIHTTNAAILEQLRGDTEDDRKNIDAKSRLRDRVIQGGEPLEPIISDFLSLQLGGSSRDDGHEHASILGKMTKKIVRSKEKPAQRAEDKLAEFCEKTGPRLYRYQRNVLFASQILASEIRAAYEKEKLREHNQLDIFARVKNIKRKGPHLSFDHQYNEQTEQFEWTKHNVHIGEGRLDTADAAYTRLEYAAASGKPVSVRYAPFLNVKLPTTPCEKNVAKQTAPDLEYSAQKPQIPEVTNVLSPKPDISFRMYEEGPSDWADANVLRATSSKRLLEQATDKAYPRQKRPTEQSRKFRGRT